MREPGSEDERRAGRDRDERRLSEEDAELVRHEERLTVGRTEHDVGRVRISKVVEEERVDDVVDRGVEHAEIETVPPGDPDSGEIEHGADGSVSIPIFEEQLVLEKRLVVRERVVVRKRVVQESERVTADVRREVAEVVVDPAAADRVHILDDEGTR